MRREMTSLDLKFLLNELRNLNGGRIDKVYQKGKMIRLQVYIQTGGAFELFYEPNKIFVTDYKRTAPKYPEGFCMFLRKNLANQKIVDFRQRDFDRIIEMETEKNILIFEVFSKGNVILCDKSYNIMMPLEVQLWKDRQIIPKRKYVYPPAVKNPFTIKMPELKNLLYSSPKELVKFLATDLSLSGLYAEEICLRTGINKIKSTKDLNDNEILNLFETIHSLLKEFEPQLILEDEIPIDVVPFDMKFYEEKTSRRVTTFSHALDEFFSEKEATAEEMKIEKKYDEKMQKIQQIALEQKEAIEKWKKIEEESKRRGDFIYNNFDLIQKIISDIENHKQQGMKWDEIKKKIKHAEINESKGIFVLKSDGLDIEINFRKTPQENANRYFEESKWAKKKLGATKESLERTTKEIEELSKEEIPETEEKPMKVKKRGKWYSKFHWMISTEGFIIVGGRNATQNELLFKKHVEPDDIVLHADIVGAPLTIIKAEGRKISPLAIREASEVAAAYSSAWKAGLPAVDVYWIKPEQVSKSAPAGEFLPKGAFMIRGTKNYLKKTELKLAIGVKIEKKDDMKEAALISGNVQSVGRQTKYFVTVIPGALDENELAKQIKLKLVQKALPDDIRLIEEINTDDIKKRIPTGNGSIVG